MTRRALSIPCLLIALTASAETDPAFQKQLQDLDAKVAKIQDMTSSFEQRKFTAVLRKPLVSSGSVRIKAAGVMARRRCRRSRTVCRWRRRKS